MNPLAELLGQSPGIVAVREKVERLLARPSEGRRLPPILLLGETGTGKGLLARAIHQTGPRRDGPFVDVNCAAIPETLLEAEMFGFERGAFTDARQAKAGLLQAAHRGTIFLDEVGLLPEALQAKLLKVLEEQAVRRLGSTRMEPVDVWVLTATSEDLGGAARERRFREDLYHRLAVLTVELPPLRERGQDILLLAEVFLVRACADYQLPPKELDASARAALLAYRWPGNIRELSNVMERVALLSEAPVVTAEMLGLPGVPAVEVREGPRRERAVLLEDAVGGVEREHLLQALQETDWNISRAAALLGISRNTLRYRIEKHGLRPGVSSAPTRRRVERAPVAEPAVPAAARPEAAAPLLVRWERRRLTLLRAALVSPRQERPSLDSSRHLEIFVDKVQSFGGRVEELSPTGIIAVFGLEPVEDAPRRAAVAAMAIQKAVEPDRREAAERSTVKLGIHLGQFMVGRIGGTAEIDVEAKREAGRVLELLVQGVEPDVIFVSEAAAPFLERRFDMVPATSLESASGRAYRLAGRERTGLGSGGRITRFVGRREELEILRRRLASAVSGHGQVVGIVGEPGIGKSRLLFELRQSLAGEPRLYLEGRCLSYASAIPYFPVLEMLRRACRLTDSDTPEAIAGKVRRNLERIGMDAGERAPYLLDLLGVKEGTGRLDLLSPEAIKARTFDTLVEMSLKGSRRRPTVFAVEDLHWIDKTSEEFIASVVERLPGAPILLLCTYRPGYRPPWMEKSYASQMALQPLSPRDSLSVIHSVLEAEKVPDPLAQVILAKAEGNPFFLEELARSMGEQADRPTQAIPNTIEEVLLARIDRLPSDEKHLLQSASVIGRNVPLSLLQGIAELPEDALRRGLARLQSAEFLYETSLVPEPEHTFKHALIQEVAYQSLLPPRREALHGAAGKALEALYADRLEEAYDRLAYHYSKTGEAAKALDYLTHAARKAAQGFAHAEAVAALQEALLHVERLPTDERDRRLFDVMFRLANSFHFLGRFPEILDLLLPQHERVERLQDPSLAGRYYFLVGRAYSLLGDLAGARKSAERALEEAQRCGDEATMGKANWLLAFGSHLSGQPLEAVERGRQALALLDRTEERWWVGMAYWVLGISYSVMGEFGPALEAVKQAQVIGEAIAEPRLQSSAAWIIGSIHARMGDVDAGLEACRRGLECSPDPLNSAAALGFLGYAYLLKGDLAQAIPLIEQSVEQFGRFRIRHYEGLFLAVLGEATLLSGQVERARELAIRGLEIARGVKFGYGVGWAQRALGRIAQAGGARSEGEAHLREALQTFVSVEARSEVGRTHLALAELAHADGKREAVTTHLSEARRLFGALRIPKYLERTEQLAKEYGVSLPADPA